MPMSLSITQCGSQESLVFGAGTPSLRHRPAYDQQPMISCLEIQMAYAQLNCCLLSTEVHSPD